MKLAATISALLFVFYYTAIFGDSMSLNTTSSSDAASTKPHVAAPAALAVDNKADKVFVNDSRCNYTHAHVDDEQHANHTTRLACANDTSKYIECLSLWHGYVEQCKPGWFFNASEMSCVRLAATTWVDATNATKPANATSMRWIGQPVLNKRSSDKNVSNVSFANSTTTSTVATILTTTAAAEATTEASTTTTATMMSTTAAVAATTAIPVIAQITTVKAENATAHPILTDRKVPLVAEAVVASKPVNASTTTFAATTKEAVKTTPAASKPIIALGVAAPRAVLSAVKEEKKETISSNATSWFNATDLATMA